ncbi:MAG: TIGR01777 family protein [Deltaproteobacteria bacterium]|nr:MAG: TIGR01777 family protein [Deltaproteobacteria bacterium]
MRVVVSGSSGLVGSALAPELAAAGHEVVRLVRRAPAPGEKAGGWDPDRGGIDPEGLAGVEAAVHLAGGNIGAARWNPARKALLRDSRVNGTRLLCGALAALPGPPKVLVSASAVGYYGDRGEEELTEEHPPGRGFLPDVCRAWEEATGPAERSGIRVVHLRIGMVLARDGGALPAMLPPFRIGLGGALGSGRQYMSWVALEDVCGIVLHALADERLRGPVNAVAPSAVTNREFTSTLARVLSRPAILTVPAFALRLLVGEMADALLLSSARVVPKRLVDTGYAFRSPGLEPTLRRLLGGY